MRVHSPCVQNVYFRFPSVAKKCCLLKLSIAVQGKLSKNLCFKTLLIIIEYHFVWGNSNCFLLILCFGVIFTSECAHAQELVS